MNADPVTAALRAITETKHLLQSLLISSETFDYHEAQRALKSLDRKVRDLGKLQSRLETTRKRRSVRAPNICVVDFQNLASVKDSQAH